MEPLSHADISARGYAQRLRRVVIVLATGVVLGLLSNALSPKGIPLITPPKRALSTNEFIPLQMAFELWKGGNSFFVDARKPGDFEAGHIGSAVNLPVEEYERFYPQIAPMLAPDSALVVYRDGIECELSHHLAEQLRQQGYTNVQILFNGWTAWRQAGFPIETGGKR